SIAVSNKPAKDFARRRSPNRHHHRMAPHPHRPRHYGVNLQIRWRQFGSSKSDVGGAYFNPKRYDQWLAGAGFRQRTAGWIGRGALGAGQQQTTGSGVQPSVLADLNGEGPLSGDVRLGLNVLYTRAVGFSATPNYWYGCVSATLIIPF